MCTQGDMSIYDRDLHFTSAAEFLDALISEEHFQPKNLYDATEAGLSGYIFRGQADNRWSLTPKAHREADELSKYTPLPPYEPERQQGHYRQYLGMHLHAELRAVHLFLEQADKLGIATPLDYSKSRLHAEVMTAAMNDEDFNYSLPFPDPAIWPFLALAQHHGRVPW
jgi:hypothetical protein